MTPWRIVLGLAAAAAAGTGGRCASAPVAAPPPTEARFVVPVPAPDSPQRMWSTDELYRVPKTYPVDDPEYHHDPNIRPLFYDGEPLQGHPTRVFAWIGLPAHRHGKVPGIVLVHGGAGTAFKYWVKIWNDRGYAAIAMDTCGNMPLHPDGVNGNDRKHLPDGGPAGWANFGAVDEPPHDQWTYHAVAAVIRGHSLLRSLPEVDPDRIGLTGISWGGYLTDIVAGVDDRFRFAAPIYGCGFLGEDSSWQHTDLQQLPRDKVLRWMTLWDPSQYLGRSNLPMLFCNGATDKHFHPLAWQKTYRLARGPRTLSYKPVMRHGHPPAGDPPELAVYADAILRGGTPLPRVTGSGRSGRKAWATYACALPLTGADLVYTTGTGYPVDLKWASVPAELDAVQRRVGAAIPADTTMYYFNLHDPRGCIVSTEHETLADRPGAAAANAH